MPHIVYIITKLELGGAQKVTLSLLRGVANDEYTTSLVAGTGGILDRTVTQDSRVTLLHELTREVTAQGFWNELRAWWRLVKYLRALRRQHPDVIVHTHSTKAGILGRWAAWFARIKTRIHTIHGYAFHNHQSTLSWFVMYGCELVTSLITTHFVCVSSYDHRLGCRLFPRFERKATIIRAAIAWDEFYGARSLELPRLVKPFIFGTVACFKPQKNILDTLRAFHQIAQSHPDVFLEIIGDGEQRPHIMSWIEEHNLRDRVTLLGWCYDVPARMARWHTFLLTSLWEGLPCSVIEARALRLPVFAYNTGGISDVITHSLNGRLYQQGDWRTMADDMNRLVQDQRWYLEMIYARDRLQDFHDEVMIARHRELYAHVTGPRKTVL